MKILFSTLILFFALGIINPQANYLKPAIGEINSEKTGLEKVVTTKEGGLLGYSARDSILDGFPVFAENIVFASQPTLADMNGDGHKEIVVLGKNTSGNYSIYLYDGKAELLSSESLANKPYSNIEISQNQDKDSIILAYDNGNIVEFKLEGTKLENSNIFTIDKPNSPVNINTYARTKIYLTHGDKNLIDIHTKNSASSFTKTKTISLESPIIFPLSKDFLKKRFYGVTKNNSLVNINTETNELVNSAIQLSFSPVNTPSLVNMDEDNDKELVFISSEGKYIVTDDLGNTLDINLGKKSFKDTSDISNYGDKNIFSLKQNYLPEVSSKDGYTTDSFGSRLEFQSVSFSAPKILTSTSSIVVSVKKGESFSSIFSITNTGKSILNGEIRTNDLPEWIKSISESTFSLAENIGKDITIDFDTSKVQSISYVLEILSNDEERPVSNIFINIEILEDPEEANDSSTGSTASGSEDSTGENSDASVDDEDDSSEEDGGNDEVEGESSEEDSETSSEGQEREEDSETNSEGQGGEEDSAGQEGDGEGSETEGSDISQELSFSGQTRAKLSIKKGERVMVVPASINFGKIKSSSREQLVDIEFEAPDYFGVEDLRGEGVYYITLQIGDLQDSHKVLDLADAKIMVKDGIVHTIAGQENTTMSVPEISKSFVSFDSSNPAVLLQKLDSSEGSVGKYGVLPFMRLSIPAYHRAGSYSGIITFTIIEEE